MSVEWSKKLEIGIPEIDIQHRRLLDLLNEVQREAQMAAPSFQALDDVFDALEQYVTTHFHDEEALMQRVGYDFFDHHKQEHLDLVAQVEEKRRAYFRGELDAITMHQWLLHWLIGHIAGSDTLIATFMAKQAAAE